MPHDDLTEIVRYMTDCAIVAVLPAVGIIAAVTVDALAAGFGRIPGPAVAGRTDQSLVAAGKREFGLGIMIERPGLPIEGIVTSLA